MGCLRLTYREESEQNFFCGLWKKSATEENCDNYYPFGLPIPERELTREPYRYGYQGKFSEKDSETMWNSFELRMYDARIGRTTTTDPYGQFDSPYLWVGNDPVTGYDKDGGISDWGAFKIGFIVAGVGTALIVGGNDNLSTAEKFFISVGAGVAGGFVGKWLNHLDFAAEAQLMRTDATPYEIDVHINKGAKGRNMGGKWGGHVAIQVGSKTLYEYKPNIKGNKNGGFWEKTRRLLGYFRSKGSFYSEEDGEFSPSPSGYKRHRFYASAAQIEKLEKYAEKLQKRPGHYSFFGKRCTSVGSRLLRKAKILHFRNIFNRKASEISPKTFDESLDEVERSGKKKKRS